MNTRIALIKTGALGDVVRSTALLPGLKAPLSITDFNLDYFSGCDRTGS